MINGSAILNCPVSAVTIKVAIDATESDHQRLRAGRVTVVGLAAICQWRYLDNLPGNRSLASSQFLSGNFEHVKVEPLNGLLLIDLRPNHAAANCNFILSNCI